MDHLDFDIEIQEGHDHSYSISARSWAGELHNTATFPFTDAELEIYLLRLENAILRSAGRRGKALSKEERIVQTLGQQMFEFLLPGDLRALYYECQGEAARRQSGVRLRLHIHPPLLAMLPWEFLYDPRLKDYVCLDMYTPLVRYLDLAQNLQPLAVTPPLNILGMAVSPRDLPPLNIEEEKQLLERALYNLSQQGRVKLTWMEGQTWRHLQQVMRTGEVPWHIFHFIGHGGVDFDRDMGFVILADEQKQSQRISAAQLGRLLAGQRYSLRLAVLNSCEGARGSQKDAFSSTAAMLVRSGLPAVLAMQHAVTDDASIEFAQAFYAALADNLSVDTGVVCGRQAINMRNGYSLEWGTPVLYMRSSNGHIFYHKRPIIDIQQRNSLTSPKSEPSVQSIAKESDKPLNNVTWIGELSRIGDFIESLRNPNSWLFFIDSKGEWGKQQIAWLLQRYGIKIWGWGYSQGQFFFRVKERQANWAEYILLHNNVTVKGELRNRQQKADNQGNEGRQFRVVGEKDEWKDGMCQ